MMISEGSGIQADSMPISRAIPKYPEVEITLVMNTKRIARIFSVIQSSSINTGYEAGSKTPGSPAKRDPGSRLPILRIFYVLYLFSDGALQNRTT